MGGGAFSQTSSGGAFGSASPAFGAQSPPSSGFGGAATFGQPSPAFGGGSGGFGQSATNTSGGWLLLCTSLQEN